MFRSARIVLVVACVLVPAFADADVLVRWDQTDVPLKEHLGTVTLVVPAANARATQNAIAQGFTVYAEVDAAASAAFAPADRLSGIVVTGEASAEQLAVLRKRLGRGAARVLAIRRYGVWPHIRSNVVTTRNDVLQVGSRTSQPWLDHNVALVRAAAAAANGDTTPVLSFRWQPSTASEAEHGPALEDYLVAIAEAGSFGGDLVLPLHERLQKALLLGQPSARAWWREIRRYIEFYSWNLPARYRRIANIGVVTPDPARAVDITRLLIRHNLPFEFIEPDRLSATDLKAIRLLIVPEAPAAPHVATLAEFVRQGGVLMVGAPPDGTVPWRTATPVKSDDRATYSYGEGRVVELLKRVADPNTFALEARDLLGREHRVIDLWNGITVVAAPYEDADRRTMLVTLVNYAHDPESVQVRVPGTYSVVEYESPEAEPALLPYTHRNGYTEFVLPALRVGGRVFLNKQAGLE